MTGKVKDLDSKSFNEFIKEDKVVIDFWASWCGPCKMMSPVFEQASKDLGDKAKFGKVNVDENSDLAQRFQVMSIPTMLFFRDGHQVDRAVGVIPKEEIEKRIKAIK